MGTPIAQNFDAKLHRAAWSKFTMEGAEAIPRVHQTVFNIESSTNAEERHVLHGGLPAVPQVASDTVKTPQVSFDIAPPVIYRHNEYRYQYLYTKVAADDDQYGKIRGVVGGMGEGAAYTMEQVAANILNLGTTPVLATGWDGLPLFDNAHQLIGNPATYGNIIQGGPTYATMHVIHAYFRRLLNDQGFWTPVEIESIQCAPELAPLWRQLLNASAAYGTLDFTGGVGGAATYGTTPPAGFFQNPNPGIPNQASTLGMTSAKVVENHYLTNVEDTIIIGKGKHLYMYMREAPNTDTYNIDDPKAMAHRIQMRFSVGFTDARRVLLVQG
jgi:hypothetical protein